MPQRPAVIDKLQTILSDWVADLVEPRPLGAFLFGSTVNEGGIRFEPDEGDLDVVVVLDWERMVPGDRVAQLNALRDAKEGLESRLFQILGREEGSKPIVSLVPVTPFEVEQAVHKDDVQTILTDATAYDLHARAEIANIGGGQAVTPLDTLHRVALRFVQKTRAQARSVAPNGRGGLTIEAHRDVLPKELMRQFAVASCDPATTAEPADLARGLKEAGRAVEDAAGWSPMNTAFASWLEVRRGARGEVPPVISHDHYLLLAEMIYDRVRAQYDTGATVRFVGPTAPTATPPPPPVAVALPAMHRLSATFSVTTADKLGGSKDAVMRAVRAARANMKARVSGPFELVFEEAADAADLIAADDAGLDARQHQRKVKAFERRTLAAAHQARWSHGIQLILWYGGTLFRGAEETVEEACRIAIGNWIAVAATNVVNPGGKFEAAHQDFYRSHGLALSFPATASVEKALAGLRPLAELKPKNLAAGFVPNLVSKYLYLSEQPARADLREHVDRVFDVTQWEYGLK